MPPPVCGYSEPMSSADPANGHPQRWSASLLPEVTDVELTVDADGLHALRSTLAAHASLLSTPDEQIERLLIVASELATNAIRHGGGTGRLRMWHHDDTLYCQVSDRGPGITDPTVGTTPPDPTDTDAHRGLWICRNLTDQLTFHASPGTPGVTATAAIGRRISR